MVKKTFSYTNFNGDTKEKTCLFALSKADLILLTAKYGDLSEYGKKLLKDDDKEKFFNFFIDDIISKSYGELSEDGDSFIKSPEKTAAFRYSPALDSFLMDLLQDESGETLVTFMQNIMPPDVKASMIEASKNNPMLK